MGTSRSPALASVAGAGDAAGVVDAAALEGSAALEAAAVTVKVNVPRSTPLSSAVTVVQRTS